LPILRIATAALGNAPLPAADNQPGFATEIKVGRYG